MPIAENPVTPWPVLPAVRAGTVPMLYVMGMPVPSVVPPECSPLLLCPCSPRTPLTLPCVWAVLRALCRIMYLNI